MEMRNKEMEEEEKRNLVGGDADGGKRVRENENLIFMKHFKVVPSEKWV